MFDSTIQFLVGLVLYVPFLAATLCEPTLTF